MIHLRPGWLELFIEDIFEIPVEKIMGEKLLEPRPLKNCPVTVELYYANVGSKKKHFWVHLVLTISSRLVLVLFNENSSCV